MINYVKNRLLNIENNSSLLDWENEDVCMGSEALIGNDITDLLNNLSTDAKVLMSTTAYDTIVTLGDEHEHTFI